MIIYQNVEKIKNLEHKQFLDQMRIKGRLSKKKRIRNKIKKQNEKVFTNDSLPLNGHVYTITEIKS